MIKVAFPIKDKKLSSRFDNCTAFQIFSIADSRVLREDLIPAPLNQPELIPLWLANKDVSDLITAEIGLSAIKILTRHKINVFAGVKERDIKILLQHYLDGMLETSGKLSDP